jgi:hydrophobic/amphiphilic exporter-1 (mainly G- bacteria), HAE1 family
MQINHDWNYKIAKFFLDNSRTTLLGLIVLIILGVASTMALKTTGFPSPEVGVILVNTTYPGASSDTVLKDITKPVESVIKVLEGIDSYSSTSNSSFSVVSATLKPGFKKDDIQNKVNAGITALKLPSNTTTSIASPNVGGVDFIFSMYDQDLERLSKSFNQVKSIFDKNSATKSLKVQNELLEQVIVKIDRPALAQKGIDIQSIQQAIKSLGESFPITANINIEGQKSSLVTSFNTMQDLEGLKNLDIKGAQGLTKLKDIADIEVKYSFKEPVNSLIGVKENNGNSSNSALVFTVDTSEGTDTTKYIHDIENEIKGISNISYGTSETSKTTFVTSYAVSEENKKQVDEVLSGLVGGPLKIKNSTLAQIGWILGGIQLVFLVMVAFVSWRAAIIAAASIPLSLMFTTIYLYFTGQSLNTLVLFSFVLVIGLVVDPALVILESIQRKIDAGLKGKKAALAAITDVGGGLFMATLTNIIVFAPFGLISGILGQIFIFIPMTIVPAVIGSYVVPLIFLTWVSGRFLKRSKNAKATFADDVDPDLVEKELHKSEIENLWPVAKWLVNLNKKILYSHWGIRVLIIFVTMAIAIIVSSLYIGNGWVKSVQFSEPSNPQNLTLNISHKNGTPDEQKNEINKSIFNKVLEYSDVLSVSPFLNTNRISLKPSDERTGTSVELGKKMSQDLRTQFLSQVFDISIKPLSNGPDGSSYQVQIAIEEENPTTLKTASFAVAKVFNQLCEVNKQVTINNNCQDAGGKRISITRIDDGFTGKENSVDYIEFNRAELVNKNLILPSTSQAPSLIYTTSTIKSLFKIDDGNKQNIIIIDGKELPIVLENKSTSPASLEDIKNIKLFSLSGQPVPLSDVATIVKKSPPSSISRIKGKTLGLVKVGLEEGKNDQQYAAKVTTAVTNYFKEKSKTTDLGLKENTIKSFSEGGTAGFAKSFSELLLALIFAIIATYFVLAVFFKSLSMPFAILYTIPLTFVGVFPALTHLGAAQLGFLEIIGVIILVGVVENVAIFLIDCANNLVTKDGMEDKEAVSYASGLRLRPVLLTKLTAIASLAPLAILSETYRPLSLVIIFGLLASGFTSLITTPILYIAFRRMSSFVRKFFK